MIEQAYHILLQGALIVLGVLIIVGIIRSVLGPGISSRVIAVNMIGTIIIMVIAILSLYLDESYLVDVCLIYALVSFLGVVVLCKVYTGVYLQRRHIKANLEAVEDNLQHQEEAAEPSAPGVSQTAGRPSGNDGEPVPPGAGRPIVDEGGPQTRGSARPAGDGGEPPAPGRTRKEGSVW